MKPMIRYAMPAALLAAATTPLIGEITYTLDPNIPANKLDAITAAMDGALAKYNQYSDYTKDVYVMYNANVPTAQANFNGPITFGGSISEKTAIHEMCHVMGVGIGSIWDGFVNQSTWEGYYGQHVIRQMYSDPNKKLSCDNSHFWPQGFNYNYEDPRRHVVLVGAMRKDLGYGDMTKAEYDLVPDIRPRYYVVKHVASGRYMRPLNGSTASNTNVVISDLDLTDTSFHWEIFTPGHGYHSLINRKADQLLKPYSGNTSNGTDAVIVGNTSNTRWNDYQWGLKAEGNLENRQAVRSLQTENGSTANNAKVEIQDTVLGSADQEWELVEVVSEGMRPDGPTATLTSTVAELELGTSSVDLDWNDVTGVADLQGYHVYRAADPAGPYTQLTTSPVSISQYTDTTGTVNEVHYYAVSAVGQVDESSLSDFVAMPIQETVATDDFESGGFSGGSGWSAGWSLAGVTPQIYTLSGNDAVKLKQDGSVTRSFPAVDDGTLTFSFDVDSLESGETATAEVFDGAWQTVFTADNSYNGSDSLESDNNIADDLQELFVDLTGYSNVSSVRFSVNGSGTWDVCFIDDVVLTGPVSVEQWTEILNTDFESGWEGWVDGGSDATRSTSAQYASSGTSSIRLRDNTNSSVMTTGAFDLAAYSELRLDFGFYARSMENGEGFWLQISTDGGNSFTTVEDWARGAEFQGDGFYTDTVLVTGLSLSANTVFRFRCDASGNSDYIYIDDVVIAAK